MIDALPIDRFHDLVASYGPDPARWPADLRANAVSCLVNSEAARAAWREAAELDADLDLVTGLDTSTDLMESVLAIAEVPHISGSTSPSTMVRYALPYAAAAAVALVVGLSLPSPLRDLIAVTPQPEIAASVPQDVEESDNSVNGLTTLALVDAITLADDETTTSAASSDDDPLSQLPLL